MPFNDCRRPYLWLPQQSSLQVLRIDVQSRCGYNYILLTAAKAQRSRRVQLPEVSRRQPLRFPRQQRASGPRGARDGFAFDEDFTFRT